MSDYCAFPDCFHNRPHVHATATRKVDRWQGQLEKAEEILRYGLYNGVPAELYEKIEAYFEEKK